MEAQYTIGHELRRRLQGNAVLDDALIDVLLGASRDQRQRLWYIRRTMIERLDTDWKNHSLYSGFEIVLQLANGEIDRDTRKDIGLGPTVM